MFKYKTKAAAISKARELRAAGTTCTVYNYFDRSGLNYVVIVG